MRRALSNVCFAALAVISCDARQDIAAQGGQAGIADASSPTPEGFLISGADRAAPLRRLTRTEYRNLVSDVFGVEPPSAYELPDDSQATGFASTANQLMTIAAANRYLDAAVETGERLEPTIRALMPCDARDEIGERACIDRWLGATGPRLFRRPMNSEERTRYLAAFDRTRANESYERSASLVVQALLVAPELLFVEMPSGGPPGSKRALDSWQIASRLALLLWDSIPDQALLTAAEHGALTSRTELARQVDRMLQDPRARLAVGSFFDDWLGLDKIQGVGNNIDVYPFIQRNVATDLASETRAYVEDAFWEKDDFRKLFVSTTRFRSPLLSTFYGDTLSTQCGLLPYEAPITEQSFGLFSQRGFLMMLATSDETAPIVRGAFVRRKLLCGRLPSPPPGLATPLPPSTPGVTKRQRITEHTAGAVCVGCHSSINPIGFALDRFDIAGKFYDVDQGVPVDTHVVFDEAGFPADVDGALAFSEALSDSPAAHACLTQQLFTFALEREPTTADQAWFDHLLQTFEASGFSMKTVLIELVLSDAFLTRVQPEESL
jgi:hypothetical protein